jgi:uncharacterized protein (TIGR03086 family)
VTATRSPVDLLERSIDYALIGIAAIEPSVLHMQTPCTNWDLDDLLRHLTESMLTLGELLSGSIGEVVGSAPIANAIDTAWDLRRQLTAIDTEAVTSMRSIDGLPIPRHAVILTGALEIAIHAWDIEQASADPKPIPVQLAQDLLPRAHLLLDSSMRRDLFAAPIEPALGATASERLVAFAGRASRANHPTYAVGQR